MQVEVKLLGELGRFFGRVWYFEANCIRTPAQAVRAIAANKPEFINYLYNSEANGICYRVVTDDALGIDEEKLQYPFAKRLILAPMVIGAGKIGKIILGVGLIAASFFMPASIGLFGIAISSASVGLLGAALVLGGISSALSPVQKMPNRTDRTNSDAPKSNSFLFDKAAELGDQGQAVPVLYGQRIISDLIIINSGIVTQEIAIG